MTQPPQDSAFFNLSTDLGAKLLRYKLTGLWDKKTFDVYTQALRAEVAKFQCAGLPFNAIGDLTEFPPQHQILNDSRQHLDSIMIGTGLRKVAIIVSNPILKLQIGRLSGKPLSLYEYQFFASEGEALAWIKESPSAKIENM